jgi:hypothetical protein
MGLAGNAGATGVAAAGSTATAACTTAWVCDDDTAARDVTAAVTAGADPVTVESPNTDDLVAESGAAATMTLCASATTSAATWWTRWVNALATDSVESGDGIGSGQVERGDGGELVAAMTSGDKVESALDDSGVEGAGVLPWLPGALGDVADVVALNLAVGDDEVLDSAAAVGLVLPLLDELLRAVFELLAADGLPAPLGDDGLWVAFLVRIDLGDDAVCDPRDASVEGDGPLDAPSEEVLGAGPASEPLLLLAVEEPPVPSGPVPSAWAMPDPLARAAPTPSVIAPAPSQP